MNLKTVDIVVIGGGVAGLWAANIFKKNGYSVLVLDKNTIGGSQTFMSQGVVHGGMKYSLGGTLNRSTEILHDVSAHWAECMRGDGSIDLRGVKVLSEFQYLWSVGTFMSSMAALVASNLVKGRIEAVERGNFPAALTSSSYKGDVYKLFEKVIDVKSLVQNLCANLKGNILSNTGFTLVKNSGYLDHIRIPTLDTFIQARYYVFAAGEGNDALLKEMQPDSNDQQVRPLRQVVIKSKELPPFFSVAMDASSKPPVVITSHQNELGESFWYLGGDIAETGATKTDAEQIASTKEVMNKIMPWYNWNSFEYKTHFINRAEGRTKDGKRPEQPMIKRGSNYAAIWPTKLVLSPFAVEKVTDILNEELITPTYPEVILDKSFSYNKLLWE